jgi:hypothetical protein
VVDVLLGRGRPDGASRTGQPVSAPDGGRLLLQAGFSLQGAPAELHALIAEGCRPWARQLDLLQRIPGGAPEVAQVILAETGASRDLPAHDRGIR